MISWKDILGTEYENPSTYMYNYVLAIKTKFFKIR